MKKIIMPMTILMIIGGFLVFLSSEKDEIYVRSETTHPNLFFDSRYFPYKIEESAEKPKNRIYGAIVPHHLIAYQLMGEVFSHLAGETPSLIIVLGPNHKNQGAKLLTSELGWETNFGTVPVDREAFDLLIKNSQLSIDHDLLGAEHSIGVLMPFIKYYLPEARVLPIIFHYNLKDEETRILATRLAEIAKQKEAVILASIDFSHYLTNQEAQIKDRETIEIIQDKNTTKLLTLSDDHLDAPAVLASFLYAMENLNSEDSELLENTNSGIIIGNNLVETTSYITMLYREASNI